MVDVYFYLTHKSDIVDYGFARDCDTILHITPQTQEFFMYNNEGYVCTDTIGFELNKEIEYLS